jgi:tripartite-type tricarboxylate transporter receptor subunit TctC
MKKFMTDLHWLILPLVVSCLIIPAHNTFAESYPTRPVSLICAYGPGGRQDTVARIVADRLDKYLGQRIVVVNKPGGGGMLGFKELAASKPDGYTLGIYSDAVIAMQYTTTTPTKLKDYDPICVVSEDPSVLAVSIKSGWKNINELIKFAQKNPGEVKMGITPGGASHLHAAAFVGAAQIEVTYVPFKGGGDKIVAVAGGHVDACMDVIGPLKALAEGGKIRLLGITSAERSPLSKEIPTMKEQGLDFVIGGFVGISGPKGLSPQVLNTLEKALAKTTQDKEIKDRMEKVAMGLNYINRKDLLAKIAKDDIVLKKLIKDLGLYVAPQQ